MICPTDQVMDCALLSHETLPCLCPFVLDVQCILPSLPFAPAFCGSAEPAPDIVTVNAAILASNAVPPGPSVGVLLPMPPEVSEACALQLLFFAYTALALPSNLTQAMQRDAAYEQLLLEFQPPISLELRVRHLVELHDAASFLGMKHCAEWLVDHLMDVVGSMDPDDGDLQKISVALLASLLQHCQRLAGVANMNNVCRLRALLHKYLWAQFRPTKHGIWCPFLSPLSLLCRPATVFFGCL